MIVEGLDCGIKFEDDTLNATVEGVTMGIRFIVVRMSSRAPKKQKVSKHTGQISRL